MKIALDIVLIGLGVDLAGTGKNRHFLRSQLDSSLIGNGAGHLFVHHKNIGHIPVVCLRPKVPLLWKSFNQLHPKAHTVANLKHCSLHQSIHL